MMRLLSPHLAVVVRGYEGVGLQGIVVIGWRIKDHVMGASFLRNEGRGNRKWMVGEEFFGI